MPSAQIYARAVNGIVVELWPHDAAAPMPDPQPTPVEAFGQSLGAQFVPCNATVQQGWTTADDETFAAPMVTTPTPAPQTLFTPRQFIALFTPAEQTALFTARQTNVEVDMFITLALAGNVDVKNAEVIADINALVPANLLTADRAKQILAGQAATS